MYNVMMNPSLPIPQTISGLQAWYDAQNSSSIDQTNFIWKDISGNGRNATGGVWPTITTNAINNHSAFKFDGAGNYLTIDLTYLANSDYTVVAVDARLIGGLSHYFLSNNQTSPPSNSTISLGYRTATEATFGQFNNILGATIATYSTQINRNHIFRFGSSPGKDYHINGANQSLAGSGTAQNQFQGLVSCINGQIGRYLSGNYYNGYVGEIIIYNRRLTDAEIAQLQSYINNKWGF